MTRGIDVSKHNGVIDWAKVKKNVDFAVIRAGYGRLIEQKDKQFENNYAGAKAQGIPVGCYWYSYAHSVAEAQTEARVFLQAIKGKSFEFPVYLDFEEESQFRLGKATCSAMAKAFLEILENAGYFAGLYSFKSALDSYFTDQVLKKYTVWVAHINVAKTTYAKPFDIWQYSWTGRVDGITGNNKDVDCNYCYKDFPTIIKNIGLNGFPKPEKVAESAVVDSPVNEKNSIDIQVLIEGEQYSGTVYED